MGRGSRLLSGERTLTAPSSAPPPPSTPGHPRAGGRTPEIPELHQGKKMLRVVEAWLRQEREARRARAKEAAAAPPAPVRRDPFMSSKHMAFFR